jgi:hypothetical protein
MAQPSAELQSLEIFVGRWNTEGETVDESGKALQMRAVDSYEWLSGGHFLLHRVEACVDDQGIHAIEIIGFDAARRQLYSRSFDSTGESKEYDVQLDNDQWTIVGSTERFSGVFIDDGRVLTGTWEQATGRGGWKPWMTVTLTKVVTAR